MSQNVPIEILFSLFKRCLSVLMYPAYFACNNGKFNAIAVKSILVKTVK